MSKIEFSQQDQENLDIINSLLDEQNYQMISGLLNSSSSMVFYELFKKSITKNNTELFEVIINSTFENLRSKEEFLPSMIVELAENGKNDFLELLFEKFKNKPQIINQAITFEDFYVIKQCLELKSPDFAIRFTNQLLDNILVAKSDTPFKLFDSVFDPVTQFEQEGSEENYKSLLNALLEHPKYAQDLREHAAKKTEKNPKPICQKASVLTLAGQKTL